MNKAKIFNIQKFSIHDGPGIRTTVFFKGCPLKCMWCHNPESQNVGKDMLYDADKCILCGECMRVCPTGAISIKDNILSTDMTKCTFCGECCIYCIKGAREIAGEEYTVEQVLKEVLKDKVFYEQSGGGVTLSGGEPLIHVDFVLELLKKLKEENINTAIDTSGAVPYETLEKVARFTDLFLYDLKVMDDEKHKKYVGISNKNIIDNLKKLSKIHNNIFVRLPIIEGINADEDHINQVLKTIKDLNIKKVNLLPYHDIGKHKYKKLGYSYEESKMSKPTDEKMQSFKKIFQDEGYEIKIGG